MNDKIFRARTVLNYVDGVRDRFDWKIGFASNVRSEYLNMYTFEVAR